jgi:hypothetical protein
MFKMNLKEVRCVVDGTSFGACPTDGLGMSCFEALSYVCYPLHALKHYSNTTS